MGTDRQMSRGIVVLVHADAVGHSRAFRMRVEEIQRTEVRPNGQTYVLVYGLEVTKTGATRYYFGRRYSEFKVWLGPDDFEIVGAAGTETASAQR